MIEEDNEDLNEIDPELISYSTTTRRTNRVGRNQITNRDRTNRVGGGTNRIGRTPSTAVTVRITDCLL